MSFFTVHHRSHKSKARRGEIATAHGMIQTPAFMPAGTKGTIKGLTQEQVGQLKIQVSFVNTYHLVTHPGTDILKNAGGIHAFANYSIPLMSDSGGFQVFSLANTSKRRASIHGDEQALVEKISEDGVLFRSVYDGQLIAFTPETSMDFQSIIGADINMAFDECTYYPATAEYAEKAMERTHRWLERCINYRKAQSPTSKQYLFGVIQGGTFENLRKASAEFVVSQQTPGIAIGGVSVGETKKEMREQVGWVAPYLPADRPVHLLGVGAIDDIVDLAKSGIDTFDCVQPTRVARMGSVYQSASVFAHLDGVYSPYELDINKTLFKADLSPLDVNCGCATCSHFSKSYVHHLFKQRELVGYTLLSYHNLFVMERLMEKLRVKIERDEI